MSATGVTSGRTTERNRYEDEELGALRGEERRSTSSAIDQIGARAGLTQQYRLRGDDRTGRQIKAEHQDHTRQEWGLGAAKELGTEGVLHLAEHAAEHAATKGGEIAVLGLMLPLQLGKFGCDAMQAVAEDGEVGRERATALTKDTMHAVVLGNLNGLPEEFADEELAKYPDSLRRSNLALKMEHALANHGDHQAMALVQLHCDQGMNAARAMCDADIGKDAYLASHPDTAKRRAEDPAFRAGFDGIAWAKKNGPESYSAVVKALEARDARYEQAHVAWRG